MNTIWEFAQFIYHQLKNANFTYIDLFMDGAYEAWVDIINIAVWAGKELTELVDKGLEKAREWLKEQLVSQEKIAQAQLNLIDRVLSSPELVQFAPPETKGHWLYILCKLPILTQEFWTGYRAWDRKDAIMAILECLQSTKEYGEVLENMVDSYSDPDQLGTKREKISVKEGKLRLWGPGYNRILGMPADQFQYELGLSQRESEQLKHECENLKFRPKAMQQCQATKMERMYGGVGR